MLVIVRKFKANVKGFETLCEDIANDFDLWEDDVENVYKEETDPPV